MAKRVVVFKESETELTKPETATELTIVTVALRALRPLGVRFSTERVDGEDATVTAWLEDKGEPKAKKERNALNRTLAREVATDNYTKQLPAPDGAK